MGQHAVSVLDPLGSARLNVTEIDVDAAFKSMQSGALLVDVREDIERVSGMPAGAMGLPRSSIELAIQRQVAALDQPLMLICASGQRSLLAARDLSNMGYQHVSSVQGGFAAWKARGLPVALQDAADAEYLDRYSRHIRLPDVGLMGQEKLARARVLLVGAGGLGSPVALYLAAAGVGTLRVLDDDRVERSNLQRQVIHADARIGMPKVESARMSLLALNPRIQVEAIQQRVDRSNVDTCLHDVDAVVDGADNFAARYVLSDACVRLGKPLVYGAVQRFDGQVSVFDAGRQRGVSPCYRCLFPHAPRAQDAPNCAEAGVLGVLPGLIGLIQATETLKLVLGLGDSLSGRLLHVDALSMRFRESRLRPDPECSVCGIGRNGSVESADDAASHYCSSESR